MTLRSSEKITALRNRNHLFQNGLRNFPALLTWRAPEMGPVASGKVSRAFEATGEGDFRDWHFCLQ